MKDKVIVMGNRTTRSETPRTDEVERRPRDGNVDRVDLPSLCRQLERELNEARAEIRALRDEITKLNAEAAK